MFSSVPHGLRPRCPHVSFLAEAPFTCCLPFPVSLPQCPTGISWDHFLKKQLALEALPQHHLKTKYLHLNPFIRIYFQRMQTNTHISLLLQTQRLIIIPILLRRNTRHRGSSRSPILQVFCLPETTPQSNSGQDQERARRRWYIHWRSTGWCILNMVV